MPTKDHRVNPTVTCPNCDAQFQLAQLRQAGVRDGATSQVEAEQSRARAQLADRLRELEARLDALTRDAQSIEGRVRRELEKEHRVSLERMRGELVSEYQSQISGYQCQIKEREDRICTLTAHLDQVQAAQSELYARAYKLADKAERMESQLSGSRAEERERVRVQEKQLPEERRSQIAQKQTAQVANVLEAIEKLKRAVEDTCWKSE